MHEQSETVERDGKFYNVYGAATPNAGKVLPGTPAYNTLKEAVTAAKNRSGQYGREHNKEGNNMATPSQSDVRKVDNAMNTDDAKAARYRREAEDLNSPNPTPSERARMQAQIDDAKQDANNKKGAESGSSTGKDMGEGKIPSVPELLRKGGAYVKDNILGKKRGGSIQKYAKGGSVSSRGDGIAQRGKTKGRFV